MNGSTNETAPPAAPARARLTDRLRRSDPVLLLVLAAALIFTLHGVSWGRVECWNRDQMAMRTLLDGWKPRDFLKPPFHIYVNHALVLAPLSRIERVTEQISRQRQNFIEAKLLGSRLLVIGMFLATIAISYDIARRFYGELAARIVALLLGTSAGFVSYAHFLTTETPLVFWMMLAMLFARRILATGAMSDYLLAGLLTGLATATKYNGLAVGIALPVAHLLALREWRLKEIFLSRRLLLGLLMVPVGFVLANPYAVLDWPKFSSDFLYNYTVSPRYEGQEGVGFRDFIWSVPEIIGTPGALFVAVAAALSAVALIAQRGRATLATKGWLLCASVFVLYFAKIGAFPRVPTRFALPSVPFLILMIGPAIAFAATKRAIVYAIVAPIVLYNCVCSALVGWRFNQDPRIAAQRWMEENVPPQSRIESSSASPRWALLPRLNAVEVKVERPTSRKARDAQAVDVRLPAVNGRLELFSQIFSGDERIIAAARVYEREVDEQLFTLEELQQRNPDFVSVYSADYDVPSERVRRYYLDLIEGQSPYQVAFDGSSPAAPRWAYPKDIDFLKGRITILRRPD